jgi:hypothetical protein
MSYTEIRRNKRITNKKLYLSETSKSLSNSSSFSKFIEKKYNNLFNITIVPQKSNLYQGTDFKFDLREPEEVYIKKYFDYYNKRHNNAYFVSSKKTASRYGINLDFSNIIYTTIPDNNNIKNPTNKYKYIYPLYYIPGHNGVNIRYKLNKDLFLINIGEIKNIEFIWNLIKTKCKDKDKIEDYQELIISTCAKYDKDLYKAGLPPVKCERKSFEDDEKLVLLFQDFIVPQIKKDFNINIDGWIYFNSEDFHEEILLISNKKLIFNNIIKIKTIKHHNIPSISEYMKSMNDRKILTTPNIKYHTVLNNMANVFPE